MTSLPPPSYDSQILINEESINQPTHLFLANVEERTRVDRAPPVYSQRDVEGGSPGPTEYPANGILLWLILIYCGLQFFAKVGIFVIWMLQNSEVGKPYVTLGCAYCFSTVNMWLLGMAYMYKRDMTIARFKPSYFLRTAYPYFFLLDNFLLLEAPLIGLKLGLIVYIPLQAGLVLAILNTLALYIISHCEVYSYSPLENDNKCTLLLKKDDIKPESPLKIIETTSFKIRLNVLSQLTNQTFTVVRKSSKPNSSSKGPRKTVFRCTFQFVVDVETPVGAIITLIPETHELPGAIKIKDFRSFSWNKMNEVTTRIYGTDPRGKKIRYAESYQNYHVRK